MEKLTHHPSERQQLAIKIHHHSATHSPNLWQRRCQRRVLRSPAGFSWASAREHQNLAAQLPKTLSIHQLAPASVHINTKLLSMRSRKNAKTQPQPWQNRQGPQCDIWPLGCNRLRTRRPESLRSVPSMPRKLPDPGSRLPPEQARACVSHPPQTKRPLNDQHPDLPPPRSR